MEKLILLNEFSLEIQIRKLIQLNKLSIQFNGIQFEQINFLEQKIVFHFHFDKKLNLNKNFK